MLKALIIFSAVLNVMGGVAFGAAAPLVFPPAAVPTDPQTIALYQEVAAANRGAAHAIRTKDYAALDTYWVPEYVVNSPANKVISRAQVIDAIAAGKLEYHDYHGVVEKIVAIGDNVIEMGHEDYVPNSGPEAGKTLFRRYTQVMVRKSGRLMFIARQATIYDPFATHF